MSWSAANDHCAGARAAWDGRERAARLVNGVSGHGGVKTLPHAALLLQHVDDAAN
jgi:hypothetical protein